jgi:hypothetical protein
MDLTTRRPATLAIAALLALAAAGLGACGDGDGDKPELSSAAASRLEATLDQVEQQVGEGDCEEAAAQATALEQETNGLGNRVDADLRNALSSGAQRLRTLVEQRCEPATATTGPTVTTSTEEPQTQTDEDNQNSQGEEEKPGKDEKKNSDEKPGKRKGQEKKNEQPSDTGGDQQSGDDSGGFAP